MEILLTNDDGIEATGLRVLYDALEDLGNVTALAPSEDKSAVGRTLTHEFEVEERDLGYAIDGTPADCVIAGLEALLPDADIVVSGCNRGANLGAYTLGRSGTVSAAVEAAFFDVPAIAISLYIPAAGALSWEELAEAEASYSEAVRATEYLVEHAPSAGVFDRADYLNVNVPHLPNDRTAPMAVTKPSLVYEMTAAHDDGIVTLSDGIWAKMADGDVPDPEGTDRRAVVDGEISVSPLTAPHAVEHHETLDALADAY